jgi:molybdopterin synthase catalytic subunit
MPSLRDPGGRVREPPPGAAGSERTAEGVDRDPWPGQARGDRDWIAVTEQALPVDGVLDWVARPSCGAIVSFAGTVRDHSEGRPSVTSLEYEVYPEHAVPRLETVAASARAQWPMIARLAMLHRVGRLDVGEVSVVVAVSTPHRAEAFDAAEYCIDTLKHSVPVWKRETWADGTAWSECAHEIEEPER